jgi:phage terminase large subunit-like protein
MHQNEYSEYKYTSRGVQFAIDVLEGRQIACKWVRLACRRFFNDLDRADCGAMTYVFDPRKSERRLRFASLLPHVKGKWRGQLFDPDPWQCFIIMNVHGWIDKDTGMRRFRTADVFVPRKNGKSFIAGGEGLFMFALDGEHGAEVYSLATTMEQAWHCWKPARDMVQLMPNLREKTGIRIFGGLNPTAPMAALTRDDSSVFKPLCGTPGDGQSPSCAILDELHQWKTDEGLQTMKTGMGARSQPLIFIISTAGVNIAGPCDKEWQDCQKLLEGIHEDDTKFAIIFTIDEGMDWTTEEALKMANPGYGISIDPVGLRADQLAAVRDVRLQADFKTKHLNIWVSAASAWINIERWKECEQDVTLEQFRGEKAHISADAASKTDLFCLSAVIPKDGKTHFFSKAYIPSETANQPENKHYLIWAEHGWITIIPGSRVDQSVVEEQLREWSKIFRIQDFAYDPREMNDFVMRVQKWANFPLVEINQSPASLSAAYKEFEALYKSKALVVQKDECLRWQAGNAQLKEAQGGGPTKLFFVTKPNHQSKIDGIVSGCMAVARLLVAQTSTSGFHF